MDARQQALFKLSSLVVDLLDAHVRPVATELGLGPLDAARATLEALRLRAGDEIFAAAVEETLAGALGRAVPLDGPYG